MKLCLSVVGTRFNCFNAISTIEGLMKDPVRVNICFLSFKINPRGKEELESGVVFILGPVSSRLVEIPASD